MHKSTAKHKNSHGKHFLKNDFAHIKTAFAETGQDIKEKASEILANSIENVKEKSSDMKDSVENYVTKKPFQSIGIAMVVGLVVGYLLRKNKTD
jgi:ElaB/YqjD/DUF883 family membrane-anchored ribosome-binding protein